MCYTRHNAIIVTSHNAADHERAENEALRVFGPRFVASIKEVANNGYRTLVVGPDGSKEGWPGSENGDVNRNVFIAWLRTQEHQDRSSPYDWVEVQYGGDDEENHVVGCSR